MSDRPDFEDDDAWAELPEEALAPAGWQPIETAPRDGTWVLLWGGEYHIVGQHAGAHAAPWQWADHDCGRIVATHWMPLPPPPAQD